MLLWGFFLLLKEFCLFINVFIFNVHFLKLLLWESVFKMGNMLQRKVMLWKLAFFWKGTTAFSKFTNEFFIFILKRLNLINSYLTVLFPMSEKIHRLCEWFLAYITCIWLFFSMDSHMNLKSTFPCEHFNAERARDILNLIVYAFDVIFHVTIGWKLFAAIFALKLFLPSVVSLMVAKSCLVEIGFRAAREDAFEGRFKTILYKV